MNKLVSIIVPVYNTEKYLNRCIQSIQNQTYENLEIILIDDGSTDSSGKICDEFAKKDDRIIVIHKPNGGVSSARNKGLDIAKGEYITFVDSDDYIENNTYQNVVNIFQTYDVDIVNFQCIMELNYRKKSMTKSRYGLIDYSKDKTQILDMFLERHEQFYLWCTVFKRSTIKQIRFVEDLKFGEDCYFSFNSILNSNRMYIMNKAFYHYCCNEDSSTRKFNHNKWVIKIENYYRIWLLIYNRIVELNLNIYKKTCVNYIYITTINLLKELACNVDYSNYKMFVNHLLEENFYKEFEKVDVLNKKKLKEVLITRKYNYYLKFRLEKKLKHFIKKIINR